MQTVQEHSSGLGPVEPQRNIGMREIFLQVLRPTLRDAVRQETETEQRNCKGDENCEHDARKAPVCGVAHRNTSSFIHETCLSAGFISSSFSGSTFSKPAKPTIRNQKLFSTKEIDLYVICAIIMPAHERTLMLEGISVAVLLATYFAITQIGSRKLAEKETKQAKRRWLIAALIPLLLALGIIVIALDARGRSAEAARLVFMLGSAGATLALLPWLNRKLQRSDSH
jgi:hypothetical protein